VPGSQAGLKRLPFAIRPTNVGWHTDSLAGPRCNESSGVVKRLATLAHLNFCQLQSKRIFMNSIVYIVGLVVIVIAILSFLGLR
jgi:hypothetical protein